MTRIGIATMCLALGLFALTGCKKEAKAPAKETPAKAEGDKAAPAKAAEGEKAATDKAEPAKAAEAAAPSKSIADLTPAQKNNLLRAAVDLACAAKTRKPVEVDAMLAGQLQTRGWSKTDYEAWVKDLTQNDAAYKARYEAQIKDCPPDKVEPETQAKAESIYVDLVCLTKKGLPREDVAKQVPEIYKKHGLTGPQYSRAMRALLKDRTFGQALAKKIQAVCPGPAKKAPGAGAAKNRSGAVKAKKSGPDGMFLGQAKSAKGFSAKLTLSFKDGKLNRGMASVKGIGWPLSGSLNGDRITLTGKRGIDTLAFKGARQGERLLGGFSGVVGGDKIKGTWSTAKR